MKKKLMAALLAGMMALSVAACGGSDDAKDNGGDANNADGGDASGDDANAGTGAESGTDDEGGS